MKKFVFRLTENMNRKGQVPCRWEPHWWSGEEPRYRSLIKEVSVIDSNMFFLILIVFQVLALVPSKLQFLLTGLQ